MSPILVSPISRKALNSFMVTINPLDWQKLHETSRKLLEKYVLRCMHSSLTKIMYILNFPPCLFGGVSQCYLRCCLPGCSPHFGPNKNVTHNSHIVNFLFYFILFFIFFELFFFKLTILSFNQSIIYCFIWGCAGSSLLHACFL